MAKYDLTQSPAFMQAQAEFAQSLAPKFTLKTRADLMAMPVMEWRVKGVLPARGIAQIYGASRSGKSFLALDLACAIAEGAPEWFGYKINQAPVVYIALEGESGYRQRALAWELKNGRQIPEALNFIIGQPFRINGLDPLDLAKIIPKGSSVIVDTMAQSAPDSDENSSRDMGLILAGAKTLQAESDGLVILIAHTGKDQSKGVRGHSSQLAAVDSAIEITRNSDSRSWRLDKSKDGVDGAIHGFELEIVELGTDEDGDPITSAVIIPCDAPQTPKKESKITGFIRTLEAAWWHTGAETLEDSPYIAKSAMLNYLIESQGYSQSTASTYTKPSKHGTLIADLLNAQMIEARQDGWIVIEPTLASALLMRKAA